MVDPTESLETGSYQPPVATLLTLGKPGESKIKPWPNYVQQFGLTEAEIPDLIRLMTDATLWESSVDETASWAVVYAWRSLAQLKARDALEPFMGLLANYEDDDWLMIEAADFLSLLGAGVLPQLTQLLADVEISEWARVAIAEGIERIPSYEPESRDACIQILWQRLQAFNENGDVVNGALVNAMVAFQVVEAAPLIEQIYASRQIDDMMAGTWASVQVALGLKQESDFRPEDFQTRFLRNLKAQQVLMNPSYSEPFRDRSSPSPWFNRRFTPALGDLEFPNLAPPASQGFGQTLPNPKAKKKKKKK